jgi:hypothetical protein
VLANYSLIFTSIVGLEDEERHRDLNLYNFHQVKKFDTYRKLNAEWGSLGTADGEFYNLLE